MLHEGWNITDINEKEVTDFFNEMNMPDLVPLFLKVITFMKECKIQNQKEWSTEIHKLLME